MGDNSPDPVWTALAPSWLEARWRYDAAARCPTLLARVQACIDDASPLRIVDLGAGLGANVRHLAGAFHPDQIWTLVEQDAALLEAAREPLGLELAALGWSADSGGAEHERFTRNGQSLEVRFVPATIAELAAKVDLQGTDLVTANALFDLLPVSDFRALATALRAHAIPCYATLNYEAMRFTPSDRQSERYIDDYHEHMCRPRPGGRRMGPSCVTAIAGVIATLDGTLERAPSVWQIGPEAPEMLGFTLDFMHQAIGEILPSGPLRSAFDKWVSERRTLISTGRLALTVEHQDLLIW